MGPKPLRVEDYSDFIRDARKVFAPHSPLTDNFLRVTTVPGTLTPGEQPYSWNYKPSPREMVTMWFGDFDVVVRNFKVAAQVARDSGAKGILFDWEEYAGHVFNYERLADAKPLGKTEDETARQVRLCAERISRAVNEVYPDITWFIIFSIYDERWPKLERAFMDGLIAAADPRTRFVDGHEKWLSAAADYQRVYRDTYEKSVKLSAVPEKFHKQLDVAFSLWFDKVPFGPDIERRYSPARWQVNVENAMLTTDGYVWVFTGGSGGAIPDWLTGENLPQAYLDATWRAVQLARNLRGFEPLSNKKTDSLTMDLLLGAR